MMSIHFNELIDTFHHIPRNFSKTIYFFDGTSNIHFIFINNISKKKTLSTVD